MVAEYQALLAEKINANPEMMDELFVESAPEPDPVRSFLESAPAASDPVRSFLEAVPEPEPDPVRSFLASATDAQAAPDANAEPMPCSTGSVSGV